MISLKDIFHCFQVTSLLSPECSVVATIFIQLRFQFSKTTKFKRITNVICSWDIFSYTVAMSYADH